MFFINNNIELLGALVDWVSLTLCCGALLMWPRNH